MSKKRANRPKRYRKHHEDRLVKGSERDRQERVECKKQGSPAEHGPLLRLLVLRHIAGVAPGEFRVGVQKIIDIRSERAGNVHNIDRLVDRLGADRDDLGAIDPLDP